MMHAREIVKRFAVQGIFTLLLIFAPSAHGARINSDGSVDPDGCGGFVTTSQQRWETKLIRHWMPLATVSAVVLAAASSYCYMQDARTRLCRQVFATVCGITSATAILATVVWAATMMLISS